MSSFLRKQPNKPPIKELQNFPASQPVVANEQLPLLGAPVKKPGFFSRLTNKIKKVKNIKTIFTRKNVLPSIDVINNLILISSGISSRAKIIFDSPDINSPQSIIKIINSIKKMLLDEAEINLEVRTNLELFNKLLNYINKNNINKLIENSTYLIVVLINLLYELKYHNISNSSNINNQSIETEFREDLKKKYEIVRFNAKIDIVIECYKRLYIYVYIYRYISNIIISQNKSLPQIPANEPIFSLLPSMINTISTINKSDKNYNANLKLEKLCIIISKMSRFLINNNNYLNFENIYGKFKKYDDKIKFCEYYLKLQSCLLYISLTYQANNNSFCRDEEIKNAYNINTFTFIVNEYLNLLRDIGIFRNEKEKETEIINIISNTCNYNSGVLQLEFKFEYDFEHKNMMFDFLFPKNVKNNNQKVATRANSAPRVNNATRANSAITTNNKPLKVITGSTNLAVLFNYNDKDSAGENGNKIKDFNIDKLIKILNPLTNNNILLVKAFELIENITSIKNIKKKVNEGINYFKTNNISNTVDISGSLLLKLYLFVYLVLQLINNSRINSTEFEDLNNNRLNSTDLESLNFIGNATSRKDIYKNINRNFFNLIE